MNRVILITGGSDGLGKTLTEDLSKDNSIVILATNEEKLKKVAKENNCDYFICDISLHQQVEDTIQKIIKKYSRIDVLINNAGLWIQGSLEENEFDRIESVIGVNLLGVINMTKAVIPNMKSYGEGLIININSQAGINYKADRTVYNASKWGITGFTKSIQVELAKDGIRVTDIMPGMMKTDMFRKVNIEKDMTNGLDTKEVSRLIRFIIETPKCVLIPEVGIKNIDN